MHLLVVMKPEAACDSLIDWISDALSQGYTNLQSLVTCLGLLGYCIRYSMQSSKVVLGCAAHCNASQRLFLQSWRVDPLTEPRVVADL